MRDEFLDPAPVGSQEEVDEVGLRPRRLSEFVGQRELKEHLTIVLEAAKRRGQAADHLLLAGPPGLGKTSMAGIVAAVVKAPPAAMRLAKRCIDTGVELDPRGALATELMAIEESIAAAEWKAAMAGFGG